jgi:hypothetical protein
MKIDHIALNSWMVPATAEPATPTTTSWGLAAPKTPWLDREVIPTLPVPGWVTKVAGALFGGAIAFYALLALAGLTAKVILAIWPYVLVAAVVLALAVAFLFAVGVVGNIVAGLFSPRVIVVHTNETAQKSS